MGVMATVWACSRTTIYFVGYGQQPSVESVRPFIFPDVDRGRPRSRLHRNALVIGLATFWLLVVSHNPSINSLRRTVVFFFCIATHALVCIHCSQASSTTRIVLE